MKFRLRAGSAGDDQAPRFRVAPVVDTMLVLLSVFLVAQPLALGSRPDAGGGAGSRRPATDDLQLVLELRADGTDALNHQPVPRVELPSLLHHLYQRRPDRPLFLKIAPDRTYGDVLDVREIARAAGVETVAVVPVSSTRTGRPPAR